MWEYYVGLVMIANCVGTTTIMYESSQFAKLITIQVFLYTVVRLSDDYFQTS